ncbi:LacI family DNA-binding transcriptional regulator [Mucilaginibacter sp. OK283]|jgi:LacI family transcriptional regulator|uniref:LacI family DNA-binding transcriptional regulator n=1 Tax=Mucilaginibacter sp. OK283 TaxID=1881049 RepID=UPI0008D60172|nr:LacI family DNA-binding transcriptional regulator [Mucilaginibacter sp. OK283]SEO35701.1 transcriptional regulator, LacI family [Mucilaginibacter sp. OK283]
MGNINLKELALALNLSTATVSRALRDSHEISPETKKKVLELAKQLNYEPNPAASNLRSHKTKTIAVIIPEVTNNFFSQAINGIEEIARQHDYHVLIYQTHENSDLEMAFMRRLLSGRVDGILISVASETNNDQNFKDIINQLPVVFFDRVNEDIDAVKVTTDDYESTYSATCHLIERGCRKIAYLMALNNLSTGKKRFAGYCAALNDNHIAKNDALIVHDTNNEDENYQLIKKLLANEKPDGIITSIENLALPCYYACKDLNLNIPRDIKIISFSNLKTAPLLNPSLSTITQPAFEMGKEAANILFKILNKKYFEPNETLVLKSTIIKRESTGF